MVQPILWNGVSKHSVYIDRGSRPFILLNSSHSLHSFITFTLTHHEVRRLLRCCCSACSQRSRAERVWCCRGVCSWHHGRWSEFFHVVSNDQSILTYIFQSAEVVTPTSNEELVSYLGDSSPRVILLSKTFDFTGSSVSGSGCAPWGTGAGCQTAINKDDWCGNYQPDAPSTSVTYDEAGLDPIMVASDKTIIGSGSEGVIKGKGIRLANGIKNVIIQNIHITELNPQYVWGGDAITLAGTDMIWIDHVKVRSRLYLRRQPFRKLTIFSQTSQIGRQHIVLGEVASGRVTISNSEIDGTSDWSATCDG